MTLKSYSQELASDYLKHETLAAHQIAETQGFMKDLLKSNLNIVEYTKILKKLYSVIAPVEQALLNSEFLNLFPSVAERILENELRKDLIYLGLNSKDFVPNNGVPLELHSLAATAGVLYVLEGSANGGRVICRILGDRLGLSAETGLAYFSSQASSAKIRFPNFKVELNQLLNQGDFETASEFAKLIFYKFS